MTLKQLELHLANLSMSEKAEIVRMLVPQIVHSWPGIEKKIDVAGGDACIVRTRIPVWTLENYRRLGCSEAQILENFPMLRASDLVNAWTYVEAHKSEIDHSIATNEMD